MSDNKADVVAKRGPWTCVQKVKSRGREFHVNVLYQGEIPKEAVNLACGVCAKARCSSAAVCFRQIKFKDGRRGYEFSCEKHLE